MVLEFNAGLVGSRMEGGEEGEHLCQPEQAPKVAHITSSQVQLDKHGHVNSSGCK